MPAFGGVWTSALAFTHATDLRGLASALAHSNLSWMPRTRLPDITSSVSPWPCPAQQCTSSSDTQSSRLSCQPIALVPCRIPSALSMTQ